LAGAEARPSALGCTTGHPFQTFTGVRRWLEEEAMTTRTASPGLRETVADLLEELGDIPAERVLLRPLPGTATEQDLLAAVEAPGKRLCELVDGVLVEKPAGARESLLAAWIVHLLWQFLEEHDLGLVLGADGPVRLRLGLVRMPDVCFIAWERLPGGQLPEEAIADVVPDLTVEVLSKTNTKKEMQRKRREYFKAGVRLVWLIDPKTQTAEVYTSPTSKRKVGKQQSLSGGEVLPGFSLPLTDLFARTRRRGRR
jgi:Uma2 family endonuclease